MSAFWLGTHVGNTMQKKVAMFNNSYQQDIGNNN